VAPLHGRVIVAARLTELSCRPSPGRAQSYRCGPDREQGPCPHTPARTGRRRRLTPAGAGS